jgi:CRP-like cAMP-binding protein
MNTLYKNFIQQYANNKQFSEQTKDEIYTILSILKFDKKHILIKENQQHDYAYFVVEGAVRSYYLKDGVEVNTWFAFENDMVGSLHNFRNLPSRETFELVEDSTLISINLKALKPLIYLNIEISNIISTIIEEYAVFLEDRIYYSQLMNSLERYEALLENEPHVLQRIPLTYIASYLGISRETLSRLRAK